LRQDFLRLRRHGYALDREEHEAGVSCVATPVCDASPVPCAAISISGPTARIDHADPGTLGQLLHRHAAEISAALGQRGTAADARSNAV